MRCWAAFVILLIQDAAPKGRIAFSSTRAGPHTIFIMDADGSNVQKLTVGSEARWSPDGKKLAYVYYYMDGGDEVTVIDVDGKTPVRLTKAEGKDRDRRGRRTGRGSRSGPQGTRISRSTLSTSTVPARRG